jgi:hypothetical protein
MTSPKARKRLQKVADGRSTWARRHRQLATDFAADLGPTPSKIDLALISHAATVTLEAEQLRAAQLNDQNIDLEQLTRLTNSLIRLRKELGQRAAAKPTDPNTALRSWLERQQEAEEEVTDGEDAQG